MRERDRSVLSVGTGTIQEHIGRPFLLGAIVLATVVMAAGGKARAQVPPPGPTADRLSPYDRDSLWPSRIVIDGRITQGLSYDQSRRDEPQPAACDDGAGGRWQVGSLERSRLRLRSLHDLDHGWQVAVLLDSTLQPDQGSWGPLCGRPYDAASTLAVLHPQHGAAVFGRAQQPAHVLVELADPWVGAGVAAALWSAYGEGIDTRSDGSATLYTPQYRPLRAALHLGRQGDGSYRSGGSIVWDRLPWLLGAGWQRLAEGGRVTPLVGAYESGWARTSLGYVRGQTMQAQWRHVSVGWALRQPYLGNPVGVEWRLALGRHEVRRTASLLPGASDSAGDDETKLSAGVRWQFAGAAWVSASVAHRRGAGACASGRSCPAFEVGLGWGFERDLSRTGTRASIPWQPQELP